MSGTASRPGSGIGVLPLLLIPAVAVNLLTFLWPVLNLATLSLYEGSAGGSIGTEVTAATWLSLTEDSYYPEILFSSITLALTVTGIALVCGYPIALFIHRAPDRWRNALIIACISPLLLSAVVRTYGWLLILGDGGLIPSFLRSLGMTEVPRLVFNGTGVIIGLGEIFMPYMILSLLAGFARLDQGLEDAAASLGAPPFTVFRRIVLPLTLPGILLGCLLAFVLSVSSFVTPKLLGGGRVTLLATEIYDQAIVTLNWPLAAALSVVVLVLFGATLLVYGRMAAAIERRVA
ncbi:ABC transporter permease [Muricoccus radiodurans]|uniref:ABC transporter permease n=1 Tax=Muricoccus radiodurans TaxID=2231721 RepID=UPI003CF4A12D